MDIHKNCFSSGDAIEIGRRVGVGLDDKRRLYWQANGIMRPTPKTGAQSERFSVDSIIEWVAFEAAAKFQNLNAETAKHIQAMLDGSSSLVYQVRGDLVSVSWAAEGELNITEKNAGASCLILNMPWIARRVRHEAMKIFSSRENPEFSVEAESGELADLTKFWTEQTTAKFREMLFLQKKDLLDVNEAKRLKGLAHYFATTFAQIGCEPLFDAMTQLANEIDSFTE